MICFGVPTLLESINDILGGLDERRGQGNYGHGLDLAFWGLPRVEIVELLLAPTAHEHNENDKKGAATHRAALSQAFAACKGARS